MSIGLGRGLSSLIPSKIDLPQEAATPKIAPGQGITEMLISEIKPNPNQPRKDLDPAKLLELADSIRAHGILQPLIVDAGGQLVAGQRRLEAAKMAGLVKVPVVVHDGNEMEKLAMSIVENVQRDDLNPMERAEGYHLLVNKFGLSQGEVSIRVGKKRSTVANSLRLLALPLEIQAGLRAGKIFIAHAKEILSLPGQEKQIFLYRKILQNKWNVTRVRKAVEQITRVPRGNRKLKVQDSFLHEVEEKLRLNLGTRVKVNRDGRVGKILIEFYSDEELEGILEKIV